MRIRDLGPPNFAMRRDYQQDAHGTPASSLLRRRRRRRGTPLSPDRSNASTARSRPCRRRSRSFEQELGVALFVRSTRKVELTAAGRSFLDHARAMLASVETAVDEARRVATGHAGRVVLGFTVSANRHQRAEGRRLGQGARCGHRDLQV